MSLKPIVFIGGTRTAIRRFPKEARGDAGWQLQAVQNGLEPTDWKPVSTVAPGVKEIRIHKPYEYRVIYIAQFPEAIYVLSAFQKKTQETPNRFIDSARRAYAEVQERRKSK